MLEMVSVIRINDKLEQGMEEASYKSIGLFGRKSTFL